MTSIPSQRNNQDVAVSNEPTLSCGQINHPSPPRCRIPHLSTQASIPALPHGLFAGPRPCKDGTSDGAVNMGALDGNYWTRPVGPREEFGINYGDK